MENSTGALRILISRVGNKSRVLMCLLLVLHAGLVTWIGPKNSPNNNEAAHLAAGAGIWLSDRIDLYPVNPPLVRALAALPIVYGCPEVGSEYLNVEQHNVSPDTRLEWGAGIRFVRDNPDRAMWYFTLARWACIPLSLIGGYFCWRWAGELYGRWAAALALALWCFSPNVIAWSATICPDVAAASLGVAACYFFWRWLKEPDWYTALLAGIVLGLAELTKMTWIILFAVWPIVWMMWRWSRKGECPNLSERPSGGTNETVPASPPALQLAGILALGIFVLNLGYAFHGSFTTLGDYTFVSRTLAGKDSIVDGGHGGNRFAGSWLGHVPVPLPRDYLEGADLQKLDFERGLPSYLFGQWSQHGWWYYYIVCAALKVPLGIWALGLLAVGIRASRLICIAKKRPSAGRTKTAIGWRNEAALLLPAIILFVFVSSQTGFSRHFRYVLPAFPFLFVWIGSVAQAALNRPRTTGVCAAAALTWAVASSLSIYPHSMSYFNEIAGGPIGGHRYLLDSNLDWGQDVLFLKEWCKKHPEATPLHVAFSNSYSDTLLGLGDRVKNLDVLAFKSQKESAENDILRDFEPNPGWYAVSVHRIFDTNDRCQCFRHLTPVDRAGYSINIYNVTLEEANSARKALGLPRLSADKIAEL